MIQSIPHRRLGVFRASRLLLLLLLGRRFVRREGTESFRVTVVTLPPLIVDELVPGARCGGRMSMRRWIRGIAVTTRRTLLLLMFHESSLEVARIQKTWIALVQIQMLLLRAAGMTRIAVTGRGRLLRSRIRLSSVEPVQTRIGGAIVRPEEALGRM